MTTTPRPQRFDRSLRAIIWADLALSVATVVAAVLVVPVLMLVPVAPSARPWLNVGLLVDAVLLGGFGALGASLLAVRLHGGDASLPERLRLPLPRFMRPEPFAGASTRRDPRELAIADCDYERAPVPS